MSERLQDYNRKEYKRTRIIHFMEDAVAYLFSILLGGVYIAKIATYIGMSDSTIGIITQLSMLGCVFQILSVFISTQKPVKRIVTVGHTASALMHATVWFLPLISVSYGIKASILFIAILFGWIVYQVFVPPKMNWFYSIVDDRKRGSFTATKEICTLSFGTLVSFAVSMFIDHYESKDNLKTAFVISGIVLLSAGVIRCIFLTLSYEPPKSNDGENTDNFIKQFRHLIKDRTFMRVIIFYAIATIANNIVLPFLGTYQNNDLKFSMTFVSVIAFVHTVIRCSFCFVMGKIADKYSSKTMLNISFCFAVIGFIVLACSTPANGKIVFTLFYTVFFAIFQAGFGNGLINFVVLNIIYKISNPNPKRLRRRKIRRAASTNGCARFAVIRTRVKSFPTILSVLGANIPPVILKK